MKFIVTIIFCFSCFQPIHAQSLRLFGVDTTKFPTMSAKFYAFDAVWQQKTPTIPELSITENGVQRVITNVQCPTAVSPDVISMAMSIDISTSMSQTVEYAKITTTELCELIAFPASEFALQTCDDRAMIVQDFTTNKTRITDALPAIVAEGGNNFNEHLLNRLTGLLHVASHGKNKKIAVIFTDAWWHELTSNEMLECKAICDSFKIKFIAVIYSWQGAEPNGIKKSLQELATYTGGALYDGIYSKEAAKEIASNIQLTAQGNVGSCDVTWESSIACYTDNPLVNITLSWNGLTAKSSYILPATAISSIDVMPNFISFGKIPPGVIVDTTITVTAKNDDFTIQGAVINFGSAIFSIVNQTYPFTILKNSSVKFTLRCEPIDSSLSYVSYKLLTDKCLSEFSASSGFTGIKNKNPTLQLTSPNGKEEFLIGTDTLITWKGVASTDTVTLNYSIDNGSHWQKITDKATGNKYNWTNIPKPTSKECLVKVQLKEATPLSGIEWKKTFGGSANDLASCIRQTNDGGYIVAGKSDSKDGDMSSLKGMSDVWIVKLSQVGVIEWKRNYGGSRNDAATCVRQTFDGGYIVAGYSESNDGDVKTTKGSRDAWILKLSKLGAIEWQRSIGGSKDDEVLSIEQTPNGDYITSGWSESTNGDVPINRGNADAWVLKLYANGVIAWQYTYGGSNADFAESIVPTDDGGYIFAGHSYSTNGDVNGNKGFYDYWVVKLRSYGTIDWQKTYGGTGNEYAKSIAQTSDRGYIVAGWTDSKNGDVTVHHGGYDFWVLKLGKLGAVEWQHSYGGSAGDYAKTVQQTNDGGYAVAGYTYSNDNEVTGNKGGNDAWILKLNWLGKIEWQKTYGGSNGDFAESLMQTNDDGFVIAGATNSADFDATGNKGKSDFWVVKVSSDGQVLQEDQSDTLFSIVAPTATSHEVDMKQCLVGQYRDSVIADIVSNTGKYPVRIDSMYFTGVDASAFTFIAGVPPFSVPSNNFHASEIRFNPLRIGTHSAEIVIVTQSDTITQLIKGEGIAPKLEILGRFIDFGEVTIGKQKDTLHVAAIRNVGAAPLLITGTRHLGPNVQDYSTLSSGGNFTIPPNDTAYIDIRFAPSSLGRTSGRIAFDYDGIGSPAIVSLFGTGINQGAHISAIAPLFPVLVCSDQATDSLTIHNSGVDTLNVNSIQFIGVNASDFQLGSPFSGQLVPPDSSVKIPINFASTTTGNRLASLYLRSNSQDRDSILLLPISGSKENATFDVSIVHWDVGILCPNEPKDTTITFTNSGTVGNLLRCVSTNLTVGTPSIYLQSGTNTTLPLRLLGRPMEGNFDEILTITDSVCGVSTVIHVTGMIKRTKIISQQLADFGVVEGGRSSILDVFAVNNDIRPIVIEAPTGFSGPFTLDALTPPAGSVLAPNDTVKARIRYDAIKGVQTTGYLNWSVILPCPSMDSTELRGIGIGRDTARTTITIQDITAQAGEKVNLTIKIFKPTGMQFIGAPTEWYTRIHYNKSILFNEQTSNVCTGTTDSCVLELSGIYDPNSDELITIPCITTLGNTDHSTIVIDSFIWMNSGIATEVFTENGSVTLTGICEDGGVRLFIPAKNSTSLSTRPNPAQDNLQIQYGLREPLTVTIELLTLTGQVVQTIINNQAQLSGQYTLTSDLSLLGNAVYLLRMRTNKEMLTTRVDVVK